VRSEGQEGSIQVGEGPGRRGTQHVQKRAQLVKTSWWGEVLARGVVKEFPPHPLVLTTPVPRATVPPLQQRVQASPEIEDLPCQIATSGFGKRQI
jgi:hypothetical protein